MTMNNSSKNKNGQFFRDDDQKFEHAINDGDIYSIKHQIVQQYKKNLKELKKIGTNIQTEIRKINYKEIARPSKKKRNVLEETLNSWDNKSAQTKNLEKQRDEEIRKTLDIIKHDQNNWQKERDVMKNKIELMEKELKAIDSLGLASQSHTERCIEIQEKPAEEVKETPVPVPVAPVQQDQSTAKKKEVMNAFGFGGPPSKTMSVASEKDKIQPVKVHPIPIQPVVAPKIVESIIHINIEP